MGREDKDEDRVGGPGGSQEEEFFRQLKRLCNPLVLFGGGIAGLRAIPPIILGEAGVISSEQRINIVSGRSFSFLSGSLAIVSFIAALMGIILNWDKCAAIITAWMK